MYSTFQIDWSQSAREVILSERDDLPPNIKAFKAEEGRLTPDVLAQAVSLFTSSTQAVQIEVPEDPALVAAAKSLEKLDGDDLILPNNTLFSSKGVLAKYFAKFSGRMPQEELDQLQEFSEGLLAAVVENYGSEVVNEFLIFRQEATGYETYGFHSHVWDDERTPDNGRAFYVSRALADLNSAFVNRDDLSDKSLDPKAIEAHFTNPNPSLWLGKPGSYLLFGTKGHEQGPCFHASPPHQKSRTVPIVNFYVPK
jgi:hypothetical protein